ncbi:bacterio-opsin activator-like protein [Haloarcula marismortui ATCC 43049]|uniref:Bacterio-opsin activator-like protein n=1 Tax=Haloarcula marismortui (strain ATCC 43049 / DSM 3752 / JCM 8966 / VKM B-1809) TaxID=272569 RepID=Q5V008_HALMA|nr:site-specific integrase [Haloarcula marismortui]AAV47145.1 bacterio-opsin activator-like protein [Haloarcula marismortui ATCC 43049]QCP91850.1 site-specific integrase [Haloarcula marismortui ATCC 43049]
MRIKRNENHHSYRCWLTPDEYKQLKQTAGSYRDSLIVQLGGEVGLRSFEIPQVCPKHITQVDGHARLRVPEGKDTEGSGGKPRDAYLPEQVESEVLRYANVEEIDRDEPIIDLTERSVQRRVKETAERVGEETGNADWQKVSSHDLRRYYAQTLLVRERMNPRVVMEVGGWSSFSAIEPYLNAPTAGVVNEEFEGTTLS